MKNIKELYSIYNEEENDKRDETQVAESKSNQETKIEVPKVAASK